MGGGDGVEFYTQKKHSRTYGRFVLRVFECLLEKNAHLHLGKAKFLKSWSFTASWYYMSQSEGPTGKLNY